MPGQSLRLPGRGSPTATPSRLLASITTCWLVEYRQFSLEAATVLSRMGTRGPSTISTVPCHGRRAGEIANNGAR